MMEVKRVMEKDRLMKDIRKLYGNSFPINEKMPFEMLLGKMKHGCRMYAFLEEESFVGFAYVFVGEEIFLYYLAIDEGKRGNGYGSKALCLLQEKLGDKCITLDIEQVNDINSEQYRRLCFYQRAGYVRTGIRYHFFGVDYEILASKNGYTKAQYKELAKQIWGINAHLIHYENE